MYCENDLLLKWQDGEQLWAAHIMHDECAENPRESCENLGTMACWHNRYRLGDRLPPSETQESFWQGLVRSTITEKRLMQMVSLGEIPGMRIVDKGNDLVDIYMIGYDGKEYLEYEDVGYTTAAYYIQDDLDVKQCMTALRQYMIWLPLWLYDHGGITISCGSREGQYADAWDSGCVGWIVMSKEKAMSELVEILKDEHGNPIKEEHVNPGKPSTWSYLTRPLTEETWAERAEEVLREEVKVYDMYLRGEVYGYRLYSACLPFGEVSDDFEPDWEEEEYGVFMGGYIGDDIEENGIADELPGFTEALEESRVETGTVRYKTVKEFVF